MNSKLNKRQRLALTILEWHGGGGTGMYALGSSWLANSEVRISVIGQAIMELNDGIGKRVPHPECVTDKDIKSMKSLRQRILREANLMILVNAKGYNKEDVQTIAICKTWEESETAMILHTDNTAWFSRWIMRTGEYCIPFHIRSEHLIVVGSNS